MAPRTGTNRRQKANASHSASKWQNASSAKDRKHAKYQDDIESHTTASPSNADSDYDWRSFGSKCSESWDAPPAPMQRTSLKSLQSKAKLFVPAGALDSEAQTDMVDLLPEGFDPSVMPPPCMPSPGKDCLAGVIRSSLGNEVWNLNMMDFTSGYGEWCTAVEITIPALNASMCHLMASQDAQAVSTAQEENQSQAVESLTKALQDLAPDMVLQPADHRAQICAEFCAAKTDRLCREFSQCGSCPRGGTCRWAHAMIESFMINFILSPLAPWECSSEVQNPETFAEGPETSGRWQPCRAPIPPLPETLPSTKGDRWQPSRAPIRATDENSVGSPTSEADICKMESIKSLEPDMRPKNPRLVSRKKWSDIQEDSDDELHF